MSGSENDKEHLKEIKKMMKCKIRGQKQRAIKKNRRGAYRLAESAEGKLLEAHEHGVRRCESKPFVLFQNQEA